MFKNKNLRLMKKNKSLCIFKKFKFGRLFNTLTQNNNRLCVLQLLILRRKFRFLVPGLKNTCSLTGKYKSTFNALRVSRHVYRNFGDNSILPNFSKTAWLCLKTFKFLILNKIQFFF